MEYDLTEPVKAYEYYLKDAVHETAINYFDGLTNKAGIDIDANRFTIKELNKYRKKVSDAKKKINGKRALKTFIIVLIVLFFVAALGFSLYLIKDFIWWFILIAVGCVGAAVGFIFLAKHIHKQIKAIEEVLAKLNQKVEDLLAEARSQLTKLNESYDWNIPAKIFSETIPLIQMDQYFDKSKFYFLRNKYGFKENEENISSLFVQSGSILGNPFILERNLVREIRDHTYSGQLVIHWTTVVGSGKNRHVVHHTQTLVAYVTKPRPEYFEETWLAYGNEAAPALSFSRTPCEASKLDDKGLKKYVANFEKDIENRNRGKIKNAKPFTLIGNSDFEALFNATNRDNDVEFHLLFTPLAQKNMINLLRSKQPFGDDFSFTKEKQLNYVKCNHMQKADIDGDPNRFKNYDYDAAKDYFVKYIDNYFRDYYFEFAPLLSIPLYQQHMSFEEIFKGTLSDPNITSFETEVMANKYDADIFKHEDSETPAILKRQIIRKNGQDGDFVNIVAHSYRTVAHVEYVSKLGGDGRLHSIPVTWYEYIPLVKLTPIAVQTCRISERQFRYNIQNDALREFLSRLSEKGVIIYQRGLLSFLIRSDLPSYDTNELNSFLQKDI